MFTRIFETHKLAKRSANVMNIILEQRATSIIFKLASSLKSKKHKFLVPANICPIVPFALLKAGKQVEFLDIDPRTLEMDLNKIIERCKENDIGGVIFVRPFGAVIDRSEFFEKFKLIFPDILLIDDRCLSLPEISSIKFESDYADVVLFSTGKGKIVDFGWGGYAFVKSGTSYEASSPKYSPFRSSDKAFFEQSLATSLNVEVLQYRNVELAWLDCSSVDVAVKTYFEQVAKKYNAVKFHKTEINDIYLAHTAESHRLGDVYNDWRFQIRSERKKEILSAIFSAGYYGSGHFSVTANVFYPSLKYPVAHKIFNTSINLFNDLKINAEQATELIKIVKQYLKN